jgi:hypothetical protein
MYPDDHTDPCEQLCKDRPGNVTHASSSNFSLRVGSVYYIAGTSAQPAVDELSIKVFADGESKDDAYLTFRHFPGGHLNPRVVDYTTHRRAYLFYPASMLPTIEALLATRSDKPVYVYVQHFPNGHIWASVEAERP